jgi:hypothetical protein
MQATTTICSSPMSRKNTARMIMAVNRATGYFRRFRKTPGSQLGRRAQPLVDR